MTPADAGLVVLLSLVGASAVATIGWLLARRLPRRSLQSSISLVALVGVGAVVVGALGTARAMFLSGHDFQVLVLVAVVAGAVALGAALLLGRTVVQASRSLAAAAALLDEDGYPGVDRALPQELAAVDEALAAAGRRLVAARSRERAVEHSRRELVAWVSHDLRTPLAGIRAMAEALEDGVATDPGTVVRYHRGLRVESERLATMVDDLFELARINAGALELTLREVSASDLLSDAVSTAAPVADAKGVRLSGHAGAGLPAVQASVPELGRVLQNLLSNAVRHTPADGSVTVQASSAGGWVLFEVADACGGIPDEDLPHVFDASFRGTAARTPGSAGAGLGLAIARGLVQAHHGELDIRNEGPGCRAVVRLPVPRGEPLPG